MRPRKVTIDASVYLAALENSNSGARLFLAEIVSGNYELFLPRIFLLELTIALRMLLGGARIYAILAQQWALANNVHWLDFDQLFGRAACELAESGGLRLADAIYAQAARLCGGVLVSLDPHMLQNVSTLVRVTTPAEFIAQRSGRG